MGFYIKTEGWIRPETDAGNVRAFAGIEEQRIAEYSWSCQYAHESATGC
jgi:hypothetical protein